MLTIGHIHHGRHVPRRKILTEELLTIEHCAIKNAKCKRGGGAGNVQRVGGGDLNDGGLNEQL